MKQGEIWLAKFVNAIGHEFKKERPSLVIESDRQIDRTSVITIIPFTTKFKNKTNDDILVAKDGHNRLFWDSLLKVHHIESFDRSRFIKKIGVINATIVLQAKNYLKKHFDI